MRAIVIASLWALLAPGLQQAPPRDLRPNQAPPSTGATGAISGRVHATGTGAPLQGLIVSLVAASPDAPPAPAPRPAPNLLIGRPDRGPNAVTDASGRFRIADISPGTYRLLVTPGSYRGRYLPMGYGAVRPNDAGRSITIRHGEEIRNVDIGLMVGVAIEGRIVDDAGEPLSRISVFAARLHAGSESAQRAAHPPVITDDLGRYRIYGLEPGTYLVAADAQFAAPQWDGEGRVYATSLGPRDTEPFITTFHPSAVLDAAAQPVRVGAQDATGIDITLQRARRFRVSGTIVDSQGAPAASTSLILMRSGLGIINNFTLRTDAEGRFYLPPLEAGNYRVLVGGGLWPGLASVNGRTEFADVGIQVAGDADDLAIVTQPGIGIAGRVVFAEGPPSTPLPLRLVFRRPPTATSLRDMEIAATIDDEWRFFGSDVFGPLLVRATSLPPGWVVKAVTLNGADITDVPTVFTRQHDGQLQIVLSARPSTLEGTVRGEEAGAAVDATVYVFSEDRASWSVSSPRTVTRDVREDGTFSVGGLAAGRYYAIAIARAGFRQPPNAGGAFFDLLSRDATSFVIGDDERRTVDLRLWHWPE